MLLTLSSTAIVLRSLQERAELSAPHGRLILGTLIFQDLMFVPMLLAIPLLAGTGADDTALSVMLLIFKGAALIAVSLLVSRYLLPVLFAWIDATRTQNA